MSELSEHDRATLRLIEEQLASQDPQLTRLLARFGQSERPRRRPSRGWLIVDLIGLGCLLLTSLLLVFAR